MTHSYVRHDSFICETWLTHTCDMTRHYSFILRVNRSLLRRVNRSLLRQDSLYDGVAISRLLKITGLFCKRALARRQYSAKETYNFKESTNRSMSYAYVWHSYVWHSYVWHSYVWHDHFIFMTWLICTCVRIHSYVWHGPFMFVTWLIWTCVMPHVTSYTLPANQTPGKNIFLFPEKSCHMWHRTHVWLIRIYESFVRVTCYLLVCVTWYVFVCVTYLPMTHSHVCLIRMCDFVHTCDMTPSYLRHDSSVLVLELVHVRSITRAHMWHDPFICVTWHLHMCNMTPSYVWHDPFMCDITPPYV